MNPPSLRMSKKETEMERRAPRPASAMRKGSQIARRSDQRIRSPDFLAARFDLGCDQADLIDAGRMRDINNVSDVGEGNIVIALHKHYLLGAGLENILQTALQSFPSGLVLIDLESGRVAGAVVDQLHHNSAIRAGRRRFRVFRRRL